MPAPKPYRHLLAALFISLVGTVPPGEAKTPFQASHRYIEAGQLTEARRALESELRMRPENVEARYNLAILLEDIKKPDEALALYEQNLNYAWHLPSIINMAAILERQGKAGQARDWLEKATKKIRHEATPWYLLAAMAEKEGKIGEAEALYRKSTRVDPLNGFAHLRLATFQSRHNLSDNGVNHGDRATRLLPDCAPCWQQYGDILLKEGKDKEALEAFQRSLAIDPNSDTRLKLIKVLRDLGQHKRAEKMQRALNAQLRYEKTKK